MNDVTHTQTQTAAITRELTGAQKFFSGAMKILLPILILLIGTGGFMYLKSTKPEPRKVEVAEQEWVVTTQTVTRATRQPVLNLFGRIESPREVRLSAALNADVISVNVLEGQTVAAGKLLVQLDDSDANLSVAQRQADVAEARSQIESENRRYQSDKESLKHEQALLNLANREVERAQRLAKTQVGSEAGVDAALKQLRQQSLAVTTRKLAINDHSARLAQYEAKLARAQSALDMAQRDLKRTAFTAPFAARIAAVNVSPGDRVRSGDVLVELFEREQVEVRAQLPNRYLPALRRALQNDSTVAGTIALDGEAIPISLDRLASRIDQGRGGVDAFFRIENSAVDAELGRTVSASVTLPAVENAVALPFEAMYGNDRVYKVMDERLHGITVKRVGESTNADGMPIVLVQSDALQDGDEIVTSQLPNAVEGLKVRNGSAALAEKN